MSSSSNRLVALAVAVGAAALPTGATATDYAGTALNIIPSGQYGAVPVPAGADTQARMYDGLTPLFNRVTTADLFKYFKPETLGSAAGQGPTTPEPVPYPGVRIVRDGFNVPHISAATDAGATWATGWVTAEDRYLLLEQARGPARVAAVDAPGLDALGIVSSLGSFSPSSQAESFVSRQTNVLLHAGAKGRLLLHDIDTYLSGINAYYAAFHPAAKPWARNDLYALNALLAQFVGTGGGDEARRSQLLNGLQARLGKTGGLKVFNDLRERNDPASYKSLDGRFPYGQVPAKRTGNVVLDNNSLDTSAAQASPAQAPLASNVLFANASRSASGHPLLVGGPQIGYYYPGLTLEMDVKSPHINWRGATSAPFPGYLLIGRGQDFATSLTSSDGDVVDQYAETLCGSDTTYRYKGRCRTMGRFDAGEIGATSAGPAHEVIFRTTVHGPVVGYATSRGRRVAISSKRSTRGREVLFQLTFQDYSYNRVHSAKTFIAAMSQSPLTFNGFYEDNRNVAEYTAGRLPIRARNVDPGLPTNGSGKYEWRRYLSPRAHPHEINPSRGYLVNWNNDSANGFQAADNEWGYGPIQRAQLLDRGMRVRRKHTLASVASAMNRAATQDVRIVLVWPTIARMLRRAPAPNARDAQMVAQLNNWRASGSSRLDANLDGKIDAPGAAILDTAWPGLSGAVLSPVLGSALLKQFATIVQPFDLPPGGQFGGWQGYVYKDLRTELGDRVRGRYSRRYCGHGNVHACAVSLWGAIDAAGNSLQAAQGPDPAAWRADATRERIKFIPGLLPYTMRYTNRPTGIQQVITFTSHRPR
ncbi:MAG: penicillin acylase family protein [Solirubrobacteraceae bacterium]